MHQEWFEKMVRARARPEASGPRAFITGDGLANSLATLVDLANEIVTRVDRIERESTEQNLRLIACVNRGARRSSRSGLP